MRLVAGEMAVSQGFNTLAQFALTENADMSPST